MVCRLAMDLGTAKTMIADEKRGLLCHQPSVVGYEQKSHRPVAVGRKAAVMQGRTPQSIIIKRPLKAGRIQDFDAAGLMLSSFLQQLHVKPKDVQLVVGVPLGLTAAEKLALKSLLRDMGLRSSHLVEEHLASASHESLNLLDDCAGVVVDVGAGLTELALLGSGTILGAQSLSWSGDRLQEEIEHILLEDYALRPSQKLVAAVQERLLHPETDSGEWIYRGFHVGTRRVEAVRLDRKSFWALLPAFCEAVYKALLEILQALGVDQHDPRLVDGGVTLTGSALPLELLRQSLASRTGLPVRIASSPQESVVQGLRSMLSYADLF